LHKAIKLLEQIYNKLKLIAIYSKHTCNISYRTVIPRVHDQANIEQTSSKRRANIELARPPNI